MAQRAGGVIKNKPVFHINSGSSTYYCVQSILYSIILHTNSLITVTLCCYTYYFLLILSYSE